LKLYFQAVINVLTKDNTIAARWCATPSVSPKKKSCFCACAIRFQLNHYGSYVTGATWGAVDHSTPVTNSVWTVRSASVGTQLIGLQIQNSDNENKYNCGYLRGGKNLFCDEVWLQINACCSSCTSLWASKIFIASFTNFYRIIGIAIFCDKRTQAFVTCFNLRKTICFHLR
jgi:hypothetical protein